MKFTKRKDIIFFIMLIVLFIGIISLARINSRTPEQVYSEFKSNNELALKDYKRLSKDKKSEVNDMIKKEVDDYFKVSDVLDLLNKAITKYEGIEELDSYFNEKKTKAEEDTKLMDEFSKIHDGYTKIGLENMTERQLIDYINQYMTFMGKHEDFYNGSVLNLSDLKKAYSKKNRYDSTVTDKDMLMYKPRIGMTKTQVIALTRYLKPNDINKTTTKGGTREQYVYGNDYLYFENDELTSIQD